MNLEELSKYYFKQLGFKLMNSDEGFFKIGDNENPDKAILIKDWNRSIGINVIRHFQERLTKLKIPQGYVIGRNFALQVKKHCQDLYGKIKILTESEMKLQVGL